MTARILLIFLLVVSVLYELMTMYIAAQQRKKPLPAEVADVYDADRYQKYLSYVADHRKAGLIVSAVNMAISTSLYLSGLYAHIERLTGNPYLIFFLTQAVFWIISTAVDVIDDYHDKFVIDERYGLNKQDKKGFVKDKALDILQKLVLLCGLGTLVVFIGEHLDQWTNGFSETLIKAVLIALIIAAVIALFVVGAALLSLWVMKRQYTFTPLPDGPLRDRIIQLQASSKKKVRIINVYNESKKSTSKNAFLLRFLWHREFGIADNFLNENAEDELLGVLSHEIGHLKHKKNFLNYLSYAFLALLFVLAVMVIHRPGFVLSINTWIRDSFGITTNNYYLIITVYASILTPVGKAISIFRNYRSRLEEHEADREAVRNGYGEALIRTFKKLSSDELVNVNPHPLIEFLEYDHPGMYQRIKAIREAANGREA